MGLANDQYYQKIKSYHQDNIYSDEEYYIKLRLFAEKEEKNENSI